MGGAVQPERSAGRTCGRPNEPGGLREGKGSFNSLVLILGLPWNSVPPCPAVPASMPPAPPRSPLAAQRPELASALALDSCRRIPYNGFP